MSDQPDSAEKLEPDRQATATSYAASAPKLPRGGFRSVPSTLGSYRIIRL